MDPIRVVQPTDVLPQRAAAWMIDVAITWAIALVVGAVLAVAGVGPERAALGALAALPFAWLAAVVVPEARTGGSPGKHLTGVRVVTASGGRPSARQVLRRQALWVVDAFPYVVPIVGTASAFSHDEAQRVGDRAAGTFVVGRRYVGSEPFAVTVQGASMTTAPVRSDQDRAPASLDPVVARAALPPGRGEPVLHRDTGQYLRWDERYESWQVFDEATRRWVPVDARRAPAPVPLGTGEPTDPVRIDPAR